MELLSDLGLDLRVARMPSGRIHKKVKAVLEDRGGVKIDLALRSAWPAFRADGILAILEDKAVLPGLLRARRIPPFATCKISVISCWWGEDLKRGDTVKIARIRKVIAGVDRIFVFSRNQLELFGTIGAEPKVVPITFGVDEKFYTPDPNAMKRFQVFSAGLDGGRDFGSLVAAARLLPDVRFDIVTHDHVMRDLEIPDNVQLHHPTDRDGHRENLRSSELVVIPTHDFAYPTGQSVLLEAMACGRPAIVTHTDAMDEYIDHGNTNFSMPLHDPAGIAAAIRSALSDTEARDRVGRAARVAVEAKFTFSDMWASVAGQLKADLR